VILGIIGRDPLSTMDPEDIPFGLVAWLLPHGQVRDLIARSSKLVGHSWRGSAWRWLADDLLGSGRSKDAARLLSAVVDDSQRTGNSSERIEATIRLAQVQHKRGNLSDARELLETAASEAERTRNTDQEAEASLQLGALLDIIDKPDEAVRALRRAVALFRDDGQHAKAAEATGHLGMLARRSGRLDVAEERFRMQAALADAAQDRLGVAVAERRLGRLALDAGNPTKAVYWLDRAADAWDQDHNDPTGFLEILAVRTEALMAAGKVDLALTSARRRVEEARTSGARTEEVAAVTTLSRMLAATGARPEALRLLTDALQSDRACHDKRSEAEHLLAAGEAHGARRTPTHAVICFEAARVVAEDAGWRAGVARALEGIATAESSLGQLGAALCDARGALAIYERIGHPLPIARWKVLFGGVLIAAGSRREGRQLMSEGAQALASLGWSQAQVTALVDGGTTISRRA